MAELTPAEMGIDVSSQKAAEDFLVKKALDPAETAPMGAMPEAVDIEAKENEFVSEADKLEDISLTADQATKQGARVGVPTRTDANLATTTTTAQDVTQAEYAVGELSPEAIVGDIQGTVSSQAIAKAATQDLDKKATVQYQLSELTKSLEAGKPLPAWAAPAARAANAVMASRGLGASSMAAAAMSQSLMESAIPIAAADAQKYATIQLQNLNNEQQAALQNAATYAAMDKANLDARLTAAVNNARSFLAIDTANLSNEQAALTLSYNAKTQALFTDAAAQNATSQFNAKSQNQVDQFFTQLGVQVETANKNRLAAIDQFNVSETNAMKEFVTATNNAREQFNTSMKVQIDQSNAIWRREINTANTATQNELNRFNASNILGMSSSAQNALWQKYRDDAAWLFQSNENGIARAHQLGMMATQNAYSLAAYDKETRDKAVSLIGGLALKSLFNTVDKSVDEFFSSSSSEGSGGLLDFSDDAELYGDAFSDDTTEPTP